MSSFEADARLWADRASSALVGSEDDAVALARAYAAVASANASVAIATELGNLRLVLEEISRAM